LVNRFGEGADMAHDNDNAHDLLRLLPQYIDRWSDLLSQLDEHSTVTILNAVTEEQDSALRKALADIDSEFRTQQANVCSQTLHISEAKADSDGETEPLAGIAQQKSDESAVDETFVADPSSFDETQVGQDVGGESARHTTWPTLKAKGVQDVPASIGNYDIRSVLGRGGMGIVYLARQRGLKRDVALKMILDRGLADPEMLLRFRAEAEAVAQLQHPNIVQIYEIGEENGLPYFSLEFIEGQTLDGFRDGKPVPERTAGQLIETIARAMHFAHGAGIVHRDLKPANILLTADGVPKVTDLGLVKRLEGEDIDSQTQDGAILGTPHYMAPEQASGGANVGPAADIWALGATLYVLLTGRPAFSGASTIDTLMLLKEAQPVAPRELVPNVSVDIQTICLKCLQKDPHKRYATAEELAEDVRRYLDGVPILARPVGRVERTWRWCRRNPAVAGLTAAVALVMIAGTAVSAAFGVKATNAAKAEAVARQDADEKRDYAEVKEKEAADNAQNALQQRTVALAALNTGIERAGTDLKNVPGTEEFRKKFFAAAVEGLNRLTELSGDDRRDFAMARGYTKAGEGFLEVGQVKEAKAQFDVAHEILERLSQSESEDLPVTHFVRLGRSFRNLGRAEMALSGPATAIEWHQKALDIRNKALLLHEDPLFVKQELAESYGDLGRSYLELGQPDEASKMMAQGAAYRDEWLEKAPHNDQAIQEQAGTRRSIGLVRLSLGDADGAFQNLKMAVHRLEPFAERETAGSRDHLNLGLFRSDMADALLLGGKIDEAAAEYKTAIASLEKVREKNPTYVPAMKFHAGALYGLATAEAASQNTAAADEHLAKCIELRRQLVKGAASNRGFQRELMLALARSGETQEALQLAEAQQADFGEDTGVLYQIACCYSLASQGKDGDTHADTAVTILRDAVEKGHEGLALMAVDPDLEPLRDRDDFQSLIDGTDKRSLTSAECEF